MMQKSVKKHHQSGIVLPTADAQYNFEFEISQMALVILQVCFAIDKCYKAMGVSTLTWFCTHAVIAVTSSVAG